MALKSFAMHMIGIIIEQRTLTLHQIEEDIKDIQMKLAPFLEMEEFKNLMDK
ncbi:Hypothetical predicted protein, partial [Pelobates cultripes]